MKPSKTSPNNEPIATMNDANTQSVVDTIIRLADKNDVEILDLASSGKLPIAVETNQEDISLGAWENVIADDNLIEEAAANLKKGNLDFPELDVAQQEIAELHSSGHLYKLTIF